MKGLNYLLLSIAVISIIVEIINCIYGDNITDSAVRVFAWLIVFIATELNIIDIRNKEEDKLCRIF
jgi:hypothetical protein